MDLAQQMNGARVTTKVFSAMFNAEGSDENNHLEIPSPFESNRHINT
jgi:hypothetical protein